jgi:hypothetical protein
MVRWSSMSVLRAKAIRVAPPSLAVQDADKSNSAGALVLPNFVSRY